MKNFSGWVRVGVHLAEVRGGDEELLRLGTHRSEACHTGEESVDERSEKRSTFSQTGRT